MIRVTNLKQWILTKAFHSMNLSQKTPDHKVHWPRLSQVNAVDLKTQAFLLHQPGKIPETQGFSREVCLHFPVLFTCGSHSDLRPRTRVSAFNGWRHLYPPLSPKNHILFIKKKLCLENFLKKTSYRVILYPVFGGTRFCTLSQSFKKPQLSPPRVFHVQKFTKREGDTPDKQAF